MAGETTLHTDRTTKEHLTLDPATGVVSWTRGGTPVDFTAIANRQPASFHYPKETFFAVDDLATFLAKATTTSERAMQWTAGDYNALYREIVRFGDRVLILWGRNNARNLQTVGITTDEADAKALVEGFRRAPLKGFKPTSPYYVEGRGGVVREYHPILAKSKRGTIERAVGRCLDDRVEWTTRYPNHEREELELELPTNEAAERKYDELELDWYRRGGRPYEIEWMKTARRRRDYTLDDWIRFHGDRPDAQAYASKLLNDAKLPAVLPASFAEICKVVSAMPEAHWVRVGEVVGKVSKKPGPKPHSELLLDHALHVVTTVTRDKVGAIKKIGVKRATSAAAAKALFDK